VVSAVLLGQEFESDQVVNWYSQYSCGVQVLLTGRTSNPWRSSCKRIHQTGSDGSELSCNIWRGVQDRTQLEEVIYVL
jgi:hypothetical protein